MPPKKKGTGGKKEKKAGKNKGDKQPQLTVREAVLAFQIEVKERDLAKLTEEFDVLKDKNRKLRYRNEKLKKEQHEHIKTLLKQAKENEKEVEQVSIVKQEEVEKAVAGKINMMKVLIAEQDEVRKNISSLVDKIEKTKEVIALRNEYKTNGQVVNGNTISTLRQKISQMETAFQEVTAHLNHSLKIAKEEIEQQAKETLTKHKKIASEEAINSIKKDDKQEFTDHQWLKKEVSIHTEAFEEMSLIVENLERENLEMIQQLFDCKVEDLNLARKFYLASVHDVDESSDEDIIDQNNEFSGENEVRDDVYDREKLLENYLLHDQCLESPRLGPLDLHLLSIVGTKAPIHKVNDSELQVVASKTQDININTDSNNELWPISKNMLRTLTIK